MHVIRRDPRIMQACFHPTTDDLDGRVARGAAWMGTLVVVRTVLTLGATAILARLLTPSDYGYVAMATVVTELGAMLCVFGLPAIIVRAPHLTRLDLDSGFWFSVALGTTVVVAIASASNLIAELFHEPNVAPIICALSSMILFEEFSAIHQSIAYRLALFRYEFIGHLTNLLVRIVTSIGFALAGFGVWSLVWGSVAGRAAQFVLIWYLIPYVPRLRFNPDFIRRNWRMGGSFFGSAAVTYAGSNVDTAAVGRLFGAVPLGYYQTGFALPEELRTRIAMSVQRVLFPAFALVQSDDRAFRHNALKSIRLLGTIAIPMGVGMCVLAMPIVRLLYGEQWLPMVPLLQIAAVIGILRAIQPLISNIFAAKGRPDVEFKITLSLLPLLALCVLAGSRFGPFGVAAGVLAYNIVLLVSTCIALRCIGLDSLETLTALAPPAFASIVMGCGLLALDVTNALPWSTITVELVANVALGVTLFLAALWLISRRTLADVHSVWIHLRAGR